MVNCIALLSMTQDLLNPKSKGTAKSLDYITQSSSGSAASSVLGGACADVDHTRASPFEAT